MISLLIIFRAKPTNERTFIPNGNRTYQMQATISLNIVWFNYWNQEYWISNRLELINQRRRKFRCNQGTLSKFNKFQTEKTGSVSANYHWTARKRTEKFVGHSQNEWQRLPGRDKKRNELYLRYWFLKYLLAILRSKQYFSDPINSTNTRFIVDWASWTGNNCSINVWKLILAKCTFSYPTVLPMFAKFEKKNRVFWSLYLSQTEFGQKSL